MQDRIASAHDIYDVRALARRRLPKGIFEYIDRGTDDEVAMAYNRTAFDRIKFRPRALVDVSGASTQTELFGRRIAMPMAIAPTGSAGLVWFEGEVELARAAAATGIPFILATRATSSVETIAERAGGAPWLQLYIWKDRAMSYRLADRARAAGFEVLVVTVDTPVAPSRKYNMRNGYGLPFRMSPRALRDMAFHPVWLVSVIGKYLLKTGLPRFENIEGRPRITDMVNPGPTRSDSLTWDDIRELRKRWPGILVVKGILRPDDAKRAVDCGTDGIVLSNHGGRNLDSAVSPMDVLPQVAELVGDRATILVDSGIRRGSDVVKALALGAKGVLTGRPALYGAAIGGQAGVQKVLALFRSEILTTMGMLGCAEVNDLDREILCPETVRDRSPITGEPLATMQDTQRKSMTDTA